MLSTDNLIAKKEILSQKAAPKSAIGKAVHYTLDQWQYLERYLEDGRLELSNMQNGAPNRL